MKNYEEPILQIIEMEMEDVIATSFGDGDNQTPGQGAGGLPVIP